VYYSGADDGGGDRGVQGGEGLEFGGGGGAEEGVFVRGGVECEMMFVVVCYGKMGLGIFRCEDF